MTVDELADACEKATGPDRELDGKIAALCFNAEVQRLSIGPGYRHEEVCTIDRSSAAPLSKPVARYTASLDAALTLVPDGAGAVGELFKIESWNNQSAHPPHVMASAWVVGARRAYAATPALALCAAALRSHARMKEDGR